MHEVELATLLLRMANDQHVDVETAAEELASVSLPSFVDARAFRSAVVSSVESHLRAQMEERLQSIRRRFDAEPAPSMPTGRTGGGNVAVTPVPGTVWHVHDGSSVDDRADATLTDLAPLASDVAPDTTVAADEEMPSDATMVWTTRHG